MDQLFQQISTLPSQLMTLFFPLFLFIAFFIMILTGGPADCTPMPALCY